jgi:hypothetical protein
MINDSQPYEIGMPFHAAMAITVVLVFTISLIAFKFTQTTLAPGLLWSGLGEGLAGYEAALMLIDRRAAEARSKGN